MPTMLSVRGRIVALAAVLLLLSMSISGTAWYALNRSSDTISDSVRAGNYLGYLIVSNRELAGADRRIINYIQTGRTDDEQRYAKRKADAEDAFSKAIELVQDDPVRRQTMLNLRQGIHDFFAAADDLIRERRSLGERAAGIRDGLIALGATSAADGTLNTYLEVLQRDARATMLAVLDPSDARQQSLGNLVDAARPPIPGTLGPQFNESGRSLGTDNTIAALQSVGMAQREPSGTGARQTASNSAAGIDTQLLLVSKKAAEVAKALPAGNPAADGLMQILIVTAIALIGGTLLAGFTARRVGGSLGALSAAMAGLSRGDATVEIPHFNGTDELGTMARALAVLKQNIDRFASVTTAMKLVAGGERAVEIPELHSAGEIGAMARIVQTLKQKSNGSEEGPATNVAIRNMAAVVSRAAGGDLTVRVPVDGATGSLKELSGEINLLLDNSSAAFQELAQSTRGVALALAESRAAAEKISNGSEAQTAAATQVASALAEAESALRRICTDVLSAKDRAGEASELGEQSLVAVDRLAVVVDEILRTSRHMNEISQDIAEIASRTQFLCLNASIEAARVGEHGKGFVVVAQEVGKLAENASQHSKQLAALVDRGGTALTDGKSTTDLMCRTIGKLVGELRQTMQIIGASAAGLEEEQRAGALRIGNRISCLLETAGAGSAAAGDIMAKMDQIEQSAEAARSRISQLRLDDRNGLP